MNYLSPNLFYGTSIAVNILVLSKSKKENTIQFIDASGEEFFKKATNNNVLTSEHVDDIMEMFDSKLDIEHVTKSIALDDIEKNEYNLSVSNYVEPKDVREVIDIKKLNEELRTTVESIDKLRSEIDVIVAEIETAESNT